MLALVLLCGLVAPALLAQTTPPTTVRGKVYIDDNLNQKFDVGETLLPNIWITDGHNLCQSQSDGSYSLKLHPRARFVYIRIPAYYDPSGHFWQALPCAPSADFGLIPRPNQPASLIQTSDNEENTYREWMDELKAYVQNHPVGTILTTGDICYEKGLKMHAREFTTEKLGVRAHHSMGNHDLIKYGDYGEAMYEELFGPCWYSFDLGRAHFIVFPMFSGDNPTGFNVREIFDWIEKDLKSLPTGQKTVLVAHDLFLKDIDGRPLLIFRNDSLDLSAYPIEAYLHGHRHNQKTHILPGTSIKIYGTGNANKGGRDHSPALYRLFHIQEDGSLKSETRYTLQNARLQAHLGQGNDPQHLTVVAYHSPSHIVSVVLESGDPQRSSRSIALQQSSDWAWSSPSPLKPLEWSQSRLVSTTANGSRFVSPLLPSERLEWSLPLGGMTSIYPPLLAQDRLYIATFDYEMGPGNQVCAIDPEAGNMLWKTPLPNAIASQMAWDGGRLLAIDICGRLYALDGLSGKIVWERQMFGWFPNTFQQGVVARGGLAYVCAGNTAMAVRCSDGEIVWNQQLNPGTTNSSGSTVIYNDLLLSGTHWSRRYALNIQDGKEVWRQDADGLRNFESAPTAYGGLLYYSGFDFLTVVNPTDGTVVQKRPMASATLGSASSPYVDKDFVFVGSSDRGLFAFSRDSLSPLWNFRSHAALTYTVAYAKDNQQSIEATPIRVDDVVYVGAADGYLYALDAPSGTFLWSFYAGAPLLSSPIYHNGYLYQTDMAGNLYKLKINS